MAKHDKELTQVRESLLGVGDVTAEAAIKLAKIAEQMGKLIDEKNNQNKELIKLHAQAKLLGEKAPSPLDKRTANELEKTIGEVIKRNDDQKKELKAAKKNIKEVQEELKSSGPGKPGR